MENKSDFPKRSSSIRKRNTDPIQLPQTHTKIRMIWREKISLWVLGLSNHFGYVVVLTAAQDILQAAFSEVNELENVERPRHFNKFSTGIVLLLLIVPVFLINTLQTICCKCSSSLITFSMLFGICGYCMLAFSEEFISALIGVLFISFSFGIGDYELSKKSLLYKIEVGKRYRSGSDDALIVASLYYAIIRFCGVDMFYVFLSLVPLPVLALLCFWFLMRPPPVSTEFDEISDSEYPLEMFNARPTLVLFGDKLEYVIYLMKYVVPLGIIIFLQGFVNQGISEFIYFRGIYFDINCQYRFFICSYNFGVYACLTTKNLLLTEYIPICTCISFVLACFFICDAIFFLTGYMWLIILLAYIQGLITGVAYTSAFDKMLRTEPGNYLDTADAVLKNSLSVALILSGIAGNVAHHLLSQTTEPSRP